MSADCVEMLRHVLDVLAPALTLIGVALSVWGTYRQIAAGLPFTSTGFMRTTLRSFWLVITFRVKRADREAAVASAFGVLNSRNGPVSLLGVYMIFIGFAVQGFGTLLWLVDAILTLATTEKH